MIIRKLMLRMMRWIWQISSNVIEVDILSLNLKCSFVFRFTASILWKQSVIGRERRENVQWILSRKIFQNTAISIRQYFYQTICWRKLWNWYSYQREWDVSKVIRVLGTITITDRSGNIRVWVWLFDTHLSNSLEASQYPAGQKIWHCIFSALVETLINKFL